MNLLKRSVIAFSWNMGANLISVAVQFVRSILLARLLSVEVFGAYAFASSWVALTILFTGFGMDGAFLHRCEETEDINKAASVHFTLTTILLSIWILVMLLGALFFTDGIYQQALIFLILVRGSVQLAETPRLILVRQVIHKRLALMEVIISITTTIGALILAYMGLGIWALLITDLITLFFTIVFLYLWQPVWKMQWVWSKPTVRYFFNFGRHNFGATLLSRALDRIDDLWTGIFLGKTPLGYYSRAYTFATYPRQVLATPVNSVASGTYAELKNDTRRLSQAFFRSNALLIRSGFFFAGILTLVIPEFIHLVIGVKWLPMLTTFRLMLLFTLLDPIKTTIASLFIALGKPSVVLRSRVIQLVVLIIGLFTLGYYYGIEGVAIAVDIMLLSGIGMLMWQARQYIQFSVRKLFLVPGIALLSGLLLVFSTVGFLDWSVYTWQTALYKGGAFSLIYGFILFLWEREEVTEMVYLIRSKVLQTNS